MNFYFIFLLLTKAFIAHKFIRGEAFYFVFWRASIFFYSLLAVGAFLANFIWSIHVFSYDISNFLVPLLDLLYFLIFLIFFLSILGKYAPSVSASYFKLTVNLLLFSSLFYSSLNTYFLIKGLDVSPLELFFPFGALLKFVWIIGPLFGAFYYSKLSKHQKILLVASILLLFLLLMFSGRRSVLLFALFFFTFWCWRVSLLKKFLFILSLGIFYSSINLHIISFKESASKQAHSKIKSSLSERLDNVQKTNKNISFIDPSVKRILHQYLLIKPVFNNLQKTEGVGLSPLMTAIYAPIPSLFLENKPWPGSIDGNWRTAFGYLVNKIAFNSGWNMSEYPVSLEFMWYGSYLIVFISIISSVIIMVTLYRVAIVFKDRLVILPLLTTNPGDYDYFQPTLIKLIEMISYIYIPGIFVLIIFMTIRTLFGSNNIKNNSKLPIRLDKK